MKQVSTEKKIEEWNKQAGVWVKEAKDFIRTCAHGFDHDKDAHKYGSFCRVCHAEKLIAEEGRLDEQPIPVNQDETELWENIIVKIENAEFLKHKYIDTINELKSKYSVQLKSSPSPTPVQPNEIKNELDFIMGKKYSWAGHFAGVVQTGLIPKLGKGYCFNDCGKINTLFFNKDRGLLERLFYTVDETMICPMTKKHCDDECCSVGSECNLKPSESAQQPTPVQEGLRWSDNDMMNLIEWCGGEEGFNLIDDGETTKTLFYKYLQSNSKEEVK